MMFIKIKLNILDRRVVSRVLGVLDFREFWS